MPEYIVASTIVTDDIWLPGRIHAGRFLGGAGIYALSGLSLWCGDVLLVTGRGTDFAGQCADWFHRNHCSERGLLPREEPTPVTVVQYDSKGRRTDQPTRGWEHYRKMEASASEITAMIDGNTKGVYVFQEIPPGYWEELLSAKSKYHFALEWEVNETALRPPKKSDVRKIAERCDILSLNLAEACVLLDETQPEAVAANLLSWDIPLIYLRMGKRGAVILRNGTSVWVPSIPVSAVDPTGAGNASSAGVLYGYCQGFDALRCGLLGNLSAGECIRQYGPPEVLAASRERASKHLRELTQTG